VELTLAGDVRYSIDEAKHLIAGYCLTLDPLPPWTNRDSQRRTFGDRQSDLVAPRWAYGNYDNIPSMSGPLGSTDLYVIAGLNAQVGSAEMGPIRAIAADASDALARIPDDVCFWDLARDELLNPPAGSHSWWLHRSWWVMDGVPRIGVARSHKVLHHKRPKLVPLLDGQTVPLQEAATRRARGNTWVQIHDDVVEHMSHFTELEEWFAALPGRRMPLFRLRLHDILLWCDVTGDREDAAKAGKSVLEILEGAVDGRVVGFPLVEDGG
jgi:Family of unknown function (DUF6308)